MQSTEEKNKIPRFPKDRDFFLDFEENIYQVIGYIHLPDRVLCAKKYQKISEPNTNTAEFLWTSRTTKNQYRRIIKCYSAEDVRNSMETDEQFVQKSALYGIPLLYFPKEKIKTYLVPITKLSRLYELVSEKKVEALKDLRSGQLIAMNAGSIIIDKANLELGSIGITGSILLEMDHDKSDIDLLVYGIKACRAVLEWAKQLPMESKGLRKLNYSEILQKTQEYCIKYNISEKEALEIIKRKETFIFYNKIPVSIKFNPTDTEISNNPFAIINSETTRFESIGTIKLLAEIIETDWQFFYPSLIFIKTIDVLESHHSANLESKNNENSSSYYQMPITRLVLFEQDLSGFFERGNKIEIYGLWQVALNVPDETKVFPQMGTKDTGQIVIGTKEMQGKEYIRII